MADTIQCDKCHYEFDFGAVQECHHPAVNRVYGNHICIYCCKGCKYLYRSPYSGGVGCNYNRSD